MSKKENSQGKIPVSYNCYYCGHPVRMLVKYLPQLDPCVCSKYSCNEKLEADKQLLRSEDYQHHVLRELLKIAAVLTKKSPGYQKFAKPHITILAVSNSLYHIEDRKCLGEVVDSDREVFRVRHPGQFTTTSYARSCVLEAR